MSKTPKTDKWAECCDVCDSSGIPYTMIESVPSQIARELELENAELMDALERLVRWTPEDASNLALGVAKAAIAKAKANKKI